MAKSATGKGSHFAAGSSGTKSKAPQPGKKASHKAAMKVPNKFSKPR